MEYKQPKVSVILPIYNVEQYLEECLDSLIHQTLKELEFICINDGSTDKSLEILDKYAKEDTRFVIVTQENQGQGVARNKGIELAKGEYIAFVDPDDWVEITAFEQLYNQAKLLNAEVIQYDYREYNEYSGQSKDVIFADNVKQVYKHDLYKIPYFNIRTFKKGCLFLESHVWSRFYSKVFIQNIKAVFPPVKQGEDHMFANIVALNAEKIHYLNKVLYNYRCRAGSSVNIVSNSHFGIIESLKEFEKYLKDNNFLDEFKDELDFHKIEVIGWHFKHIPQDTKEKYLASACEILTEQQYKKMLKQCKTKLKFGEWFFSVKNKKQDTIKYKVLTILGFSFEIKPRKISKKSN